MTIMKRHFRLLLCAIMPFVWHTAVAQTPTRQDHAAIHRGIENYLRTQSAGSPHKIAYTLTPIDARVTLAACPAMEYFLPAGARLWGQTAVGVRCGSASPWSIFVTVHVSATGNYVVLSRAVPQGHTLTLADLALQNGDLTQLPAGVAADPELLVGKITSASLPAGQPLNQDSLRTPVVVRQGQTVLLQSSGYGFRVTAEGKALNNAQDGQVAQVRTAAGQTVSGIARGGGIVVVTVQ